MTSQVQQVFIGSMPYAVHDPHPAIQHVSCFFKRQDLWEEACKEVTKDTMCLDVVLAQAEIHYNDEQSCNSAQWVIMIPWGIRNHSLLTYWKNKQHSIWARAARVLEAFQRSFHYFRCQLQCQSTCAGCATAPKERHRLNKSCSLECVCEQLQSW